MEQLHLVGIGEKETNEEKQDKKIEEGQPILNMGVNAIKSPISGKVIELEKVDDPVFSSGAMGKGIAIEPMDNKVYAPFNGTIEFIAETKHAIGLLSEDGVEVLIHVGMDTVKMQGRGFNRNAIEKEGYSLITPVVITNADNYEDNVLCINEEVKNGREIINLKQLSMQA